MNSFNSFSVSKLLGESMHKEDEDMALQIGQDVSLVKE
jgi:hypothetical protein